MEKTVTFAISEEEAAKMQAEIEFLFREIESSQKRMQRDQESIERAKERTRQTLNDIERLFAAK